MRKGFTLIELLIVVAIIAILAAIAVPNFLEAQTRSKYSRCMADMRSIGVAIESYRVDNNSYPINHEAYDASEKRWAYNNTLAGFDCLRKPISYITSDPKDPFENMDEGLANNPDEMSYWFMNIEGAYKWLHANDDQLSQWGGNPGTLITDRTFFSPAPLRFVAGEDEHGIVVHSPWVMISVGPDGQEADPRPDDAGNYTYKNALDYRGLWRRFTDQSIQTPYDPTNGTKSRGNIYYVGSGFPGSGK